MTIQSQLFNGNRVCLTSLDPAVDAAVISEWSHDPEYLHLVSAEPARPLSIDQVQKKLLEAEKDKQNSFCFGIRLREDYRLIGTAGIVWIEWTNGAASVEMGIGKPSDRGHGFGKEALSLLLGYAFRELNLYLLSAMISAYNLQAIHLLERAGFQPEARRRGVVFRDGKRWDELVYGLREPEWSTLRSKEEQEK